MDVSKLQWCLRNNDADPRSYAGAAKLAEDLGYAGMYSVEGTSRAALPQLLSGNVRSAFVNSASAILSTNRIKIGTSIISMYSRTPLAVAMESMTLNEMSGGRFVLGVGTGGPWLVEHGYGYPLDRPATRMKEFLKIFKSAASGEETKLEGDFFKVSTIKLNKIAPRPKVLMAGINPAILRIGGTLADGVILNMYPLKAIPFARQYINEGAEKAGRDPKEIELYVLASCGTSDNANVLNQLKVGISFYCHIETHHKFLDYAGLGDSARKIHQIWLDKGPEAAANLITPDLLDELTLGYDAKTIAKRSKQFLDADVYPLLYPHYQKEQGIGEALQLMKELKAA